jgi:thioredoxin-related protein
MRRSVTTLLLAAIILGATAAVADDAVEWLSHAEALPAAAERDKPVIIHFTADWCSWCTKMKQETYADPAVAELMREHFVTAMVDSDDFPLLSFYYGVQSLPTIWILDSEGGGITRIAGFKDAPSFRRYLDWVASGSWTSQPFNQYARGDR